MADVKSFVKEKEKREKRQHNYKEKIFKHKMTYVYRIVLVLAALAACAALIILQYRRHIYTGYDVVSSLERDKPADATDIRLQDAILTYSKDGAHCTDAKGRINWNETYEIQDLELDINRNVAAIASYNGREIYVSDSNSQLGTITTNLPIRKIAVSAEGYVTAVLADSDVTWINTYSPEGEMIYKSSTTMGNSGYPAAIDLSPNGELLAVSYVYVDAGTLKTNVAFYNFGKVGDNQNDYFVGVYTYTDTLIPDIRFLNDDTVAAVSDVGVMIFKGKQKPVLEAGYYFDKEIQAVFSGDGYLGVVFYSNDNEHKYCMDVYNSSAQKAGTYYFDIDYTNIFFEKSNFVIHNESQCVIMTYGNVEKYNGVFSKTVDVMIPTTSAYRYILVTNDSIDTIQLK